MRVVLADLKGTEGLVTKDTVAGGYGSRFVPFSLTTHWFCHVKRSYVQIPSVQMAYLAAICARNGHEVVWTRSEVADGDVALVLSSLVDYRRETAWAEAARARGMRVGFVGLACSKLPELFLDHADFVVAGEPEEAIRELAEGRKLSGLVLGKPVADLDTLPFPRWDLVGNWSDRLQQISLGSLHPRRRFPLLASRSCPEFCTYCPHRILTEYRVRSVENVVEELSALTARWPNAFVIFRDPLFTKDRRRCLTLCSEIVRSGLRIEFECETRLDHLDAELLFAMRRAGLRIISFGVESISSQTLRKVARRPVPEAHQRHIVAECRRLGIRTAAFYVFGFLEDDWESIAATINYAIDLGSTSAQFKILTPYPGTPLWKQLGPVVYEKDWQRFDGFTPTFRHPKLEPDELRFLLGAAYARFYLRPSFLKNLWRIRHRALVGLVDKLDQRVSEAIREKEISLVSRAVTC